MKRKWLWDNCARMYNFEEGEDLTAKNARYAKV
jgi:hypothetical protein